MRKVVRDASYIEMELDGDVIQIHATVEIEDLINLIINEYRFVWRKIGKRPNLVYIGCDVFSKLVGEHVAKNLDGELEFHGMRVKVLPYIKGVLPVVE